jgi:CheY-like chemotaxis protein
MLKKIGLLEQSKTVSMYMAHLLRRMGFKISVFKSLNHLKESSPENFDLLFIGDSIVDATTLQAVSQLKTSMADEGRIVVVSTNSNKDIVKEIMAAGASDYILKPLKLRELHQVVVGNLKYPSGRRVNLRATLNFEAEVTVNDTKEMMQVLSLSRGGALLDTVGPVATGGKININLPIPEVKKTVQGVVIYNKKSDPGGHAGTAIIFSGLSDNEADIIDQFLENDILLEARKKTPFQTGHIIVDTKSPGVNQSVLLPWK